MDKRRKEDEDEEGEGEEAGKRRRGRRGDDERRASDMVTESDGGVGGIDPEEDQGKSASSFRPEVNCWAGAGDVRAEAARHWEERGSPSSSRRRDAERLAAIRDIQTD